MRNSIIPMMLLLSLAAGCQMPGAGGVSRALTTSRQLSIRGMSALERDRNDEAEKLLAEAVEACPVNPEARRFYAEALWRRHARADAIAQLEEAGKLIEEDATLRVRIAEMHLEAGNVDLARKNAELAIDMDPDLPGAWTVHARVMAADGDLHQALADYHRALGHTPEDRKLLLEIAELYRRLNRPEGALATLQSLSDTYSPGDEPQQVLYLLGLAKVALGRYEDGAANLSAAAQRDKPSIDILYRLSEAQMLAGNYQQAGATAHQALALQPNHQPSIEVLNRIEIASRQGQGIQR